MGLGTPTWWGPVPSQLPRTQCIFCTRITWPATAPPAPPISPQPPSPPISPQPQPPKLQTMSTQTRPHSRSRKALLIFQLDKILLLVRSDFVKFKLEHFAEEDNVAFGLVRLHLCHSNSGSYCQSTGKKNIIKEDFLKWLWLMMIGYLGRGENCNQNTNQIQAGKGRMKGSGEEGKGGMRQSFVGSSFSTR